MDTGIGSSVRRVEDLRLVAGRGQFSDDLNIPDQAHAYMLRSPHAHADIRGVDVAAALAAPGVLTVLTGADYLADGLAPLPARGNPPDVALKNRDGSEIFYTPLYPLVVDKVRRVGEVVAVVVAETMELARDAGELVVVDYAPLPAVTDARAAIEPDAPQIWEQAPGNLCVDDLKGDAAATEAAFERAAHVVRIETLNNRVTGVPMEPRAAVGRYDPVEDRYRLDAGGQGVTRHQRELALVFGVPIERVQVVSPDVGGGYGTRNSTYSEFALVLWAAKRLERPIKWCCERSEAFLSDYAGRDLFTRAELALDADGKFLAIRTSNLVNLGSHSVTFVPLARGPSVTTGVYDIPHALVGYQGAFTNTSPVTAYRGAGRPESIFVLERLIDLAADEMGIDRVALRRRNLIPPSAMPYANPTGMTYDSGEFEKGMDLALEMSDWDGFADRRAAAHGRGKLRGIGLANYIETATGWPLERAEMEVQPEGVVELIIGTQSSGQGHETTYAQVASQFLGLPFDCIRLKTGDTDFVLMGAGSHSSRSLRLAGHLFGQTADEIIEKGKLIAAHVLEVATADIEFAEGRFQVAGTDLSLDLFEAAAAAGDGRDSLPAELRGGLRATSEITELIPAFPNGSHVCEVEIDPDTGSVEIARYTAIDDVGRVINPLIVDGQTHGGIAQGVGQALWEECTYDQKTGQLLAGSFMDYCMPRADNFPFFDLEFNEVPAPSTRLGVKGGGEGGTTGAPSAVISAIVDALGEFGVRHIEMPATPERIWRAINAAK